jgi:hypothetical protein
METICYCFKYTEADIAADVLSHHGQSTIERKIAEAKKNNRCQCEIQNPKRQ